MQTYDGTTFGPQTTIPMALIEGNANSRNRWVSQDVSTLTSMFYDPATGRIYYTKSNQSVLFYRSFSQESNIVGAERQDGPVNISGLDWRNVRGAFLVDGYLYTAHSNS